MKNIAIIGAGELGSRHLQGVLTVSKFVFEVFIVDPSKASLAVSKQRANELEHNHNLTFHTNIQNLHKSIDLVIVATNSKVRFKVIEQLLKKISIRYLVLEKVLFPELNQYDLALDLIRAHKVKCFVNHPRRMNQNYHSIKKYFKDDSTFLFQLVGGNWGLGTSGLHFIDLFEFLTSSSLTSINTDLVDKKFIGSKRDGYIEFTGTITGTLDNKHFFSITSTKGNEFIAPSISIMSNNLRLFLHESVSSKIYLLKKENSFQVESLDFKINYQSKLTGTLVNNLIESETCDLPVFEHAYKTHKIFIKSLLDRWNYNEKTDYSELPIT